MSNTRSKTRQTFPPWLRRSLPATGDAAQVRAALCDLSLHTVCQSAECPNQGECWQRGTATFMILGNICSRNCAFCGVSSGMPMPPDLEEPTHIAEAVQRLRLHHVVVTMVTRDDLPDGGAAHCVAVITAIRSQCPGVTVEILTSDFGGNVESLQQVAQAAPDVFGHNIETVARLHSILRDPHASYERSLQVLRFVRGTLPAPCHVKSGLMVGCGETEAEVVDALRDLHEAGCDAVTLGQYLKPSGGRFDVQEFISPEQFARYEKIAYDLGFAFAMSGPFVRSSYHADDLVTKVRAR